MAETMETEKNIDELLNTHFAGRVVRKDLTKLLREGANVPRYMFWNISWVCIVRWMMKALSPKG